MIVLDFAELPNEQQQKIFDMAYRYMARGTTPDDSTHLIAAVDMYYAVADALWHSQPECPTRFVLTK